VARVKRAKQLEFLEAVPLFTGLSKADLTKVARITEQVAVPEGTVLAEEGGPGNAFYLLVTGRAAVRRKGRKIAEMGPGDFFGEVALLDAGPRSATVVTLEAAELFVIHPKDFAGLIGVPSVARKLLAGLAARLRAADRRIID
jgi:CRP/FNR family cyclic AMP-dependent transcriptional regulator